MLIKELKMPFRVVSSTYHEAPHEKGRPSDLVKRHALGKALEARVPAKKGWVLGADTIVYFEGRVLGKPKSLAHAKRLLQAMSGKSHYVYTGLALRDLVTGHVLMDYERTRVKFHRLTPAFIDHYVKQVHVLDKAGAYAIQEGDIAESIVGSYSNVVGLPLEKLRTLLKARCQAPVPGTSA
ncbi:MAG: septum formation protein Maf [Candidatus Omnitrophica bacterium]|nr:septum formation protein Maf [Candidatus Omnitrophota bacterium]